MWPWNKQGIASPNLNVTPQQRQYFSGDAEIFEPDANLMGQVPSYTPYTDYLNYEDLIMNPENNPNRLQNLERFADNRFEDLDFQPGYNFKDAPNRPTNIKDWWANREYWNNPAVENPLEKGLGAIKKGGKKLMTPLMMMANAVNPLSPTSSNFNPMLEGQLQNYTEQGWRVNEQGQAIDGPLAGKNLVSGFGTNDVTQMLRNRLQKIRTRKIAQTTSSRAKQKEILDAIKAQVAAENRGYTGTPGGNVGSGVFAKFDQSGKTYGPYSQGGGKDLGSAKGSMPTGTAGRNPWGRKDGGRIGYAFAGPVGVEQQTDFIEGPQGGEEFQETVVEGQRQPSREQLEALAMEIFQLPLEELDDQQLVVVYQEAMQGQPMEEAVQEEDVQFAANGGRAGYLLGGDIEQQTDFLEGPRDDLMASEPHGMSDAFDMYNDAIQNGTFEGTFDEFLDELERMRNKFTSVEGGLTSIL